MCFFPHSFSFTLDSNTIRDDPDSKKMSIRKSPIFIESSFYEKIRAYSSIEPDPYLQELWKPLKFSYICVAPPGFAGPLSHEPKMRQKLDKKVLDLAAAAFITRMQLTQAEDMDEEDVVTHVSGEASQTAKAVANMRKPYVPL